MSSNFQPKRGTTLENDNYTGEVGEITIDTEKNSIRIHDGVTPGGKNQAALDVTGKIPYYAQAKSIPGTPVAVSPNNNAVIDGDVVLTIGSFYIASGLTSLSHTHTQWRVATDSAMTSLVVDTGDTLSFTSYTVSGLSSEVQYWWSARFKSSDDGYSSWMQPRSFTRKESLYVEDVFSTYLYTGNDSTQTINNGIDLAGKGGLVWTKNRASSDVATMHDSAHYALSGPGYYLVPSSTAQESYTAASPVFGASGYTLGSSASSLNAAGASYASWTFRRAAKFFDVVTYTGNGTTQAINHNLGVTPGLIIVKRTDATSNWFVWHRSLGDNENLLLNLTSAVGYDNGLSNSTSAQPTSTTFSVNNNSALNANGSSYVAYLFAHDPSAEGLVQCGSYVGGVTPYPKIALGWEPQYLLVKNTSTATPWLIFDNMRGLSLSSDNYLQANVSDAEVATYPAFSISSSGFSPDSDGTWLNGTGNTYIYLAIRKDAVPEHMDGTKVFATKTVTTQGPAVSNFPVDMVMEHRRDQGPCIITSRLTARGMGTYVNGAETSFGGPINPASYSSNTEYLGYYHSPSVPAVYQMFRRAPGFFDAVCYKATYLTGQTVYHSLKVAPELIILKNRTSSNNEGHWGVLYNFTETTVDVLRLNSSGAKIDTNLYATPSYLTEKPTKDYFKLAASNLGFNDNIMAEYVGYLFASCPGVSKVGSYTGNGSSQAINCGFTAGARFILIKRTDAGGDWFVWDTARGIVDGNEPHLSINNAIPEVTTDDSIDYIAYGFSVNQVAATNINVANGKYIFLAIA